MSSLRLTKQNYCSKSKAIHMYGIEWKGIFTETLFRRRYIFKYKYGILRSVEYTIKCRLCVYNLNVPTLLLPLVHSNHTSPATRLIYIYYFLQIARGTALPLIQTNFDRWGKPEKKLFFLGGQSTIALSWLSGQENG